jgi:hypothetical protein
MNDGRTLTPSGSPHKKITFGQLYGQPVPGTVEGQDGLWRNLYLRTVLQFRKRRHIADTTRDEIRNEEEERPCGGNAPQGAELKAALPGGEDQEMK